MRTAIFENNHQIRYPDAVCFCFNPQEITIQTNNTVTISIAANGKKYTDVRSSYSGKVYADISCYMRSFFSVDTSLLQSIRVSVTVSTSVDNFSFTTDSIWGAINIGEVFNAPRVVRWFRKFPFTFSLFVAEGATVRFRYDQNRYVTKNLSTGLNHINVAGLVPSAKDFAVIRLDEDLPASTFEYTFDNTFTPIGDGAVINRLVVDSSECGIYLRWIDRHGFYQYWLFQIGDNILQVSTNGELLYQTFSDNKYAYYGVSRQSKKMQKSIKACATLIDQDTFDMLSTLHTSPLIDLYHEGKWFPVRLATGTVNHLRKPLQDFEIEIMLPEIISQIL